MRGKDPFQKPYFESDKERSQRIRREVDSTLRRTDVKAADLFELCSILSITEKSVIATYPRSSVSKLPRYVTKWENALREVLGRPILLVVRTEG